MQKHAVQGISINRNSRYNLHCRRGVDKKTVAERIAPLPMGIAAILYAYQIVQSLWVMPDLKRARINRAAHT